jgi:protein TonB
MGRSGEVTIACTASRRGDLTRCKVVKEAPLGFGFGQAALSLAPAFRFRPSTRDGLSLEGAKVTLPIKFSPPDMPQYRP